MFRGRLTKFEVYYEFKAYDDWISHIFLELILNGVFSSFLMPLIEKSQIP